MQADDRDRRQGDGGQDIDHHDFAVPGQIACRVVPEHADRIWPRGNQPAWSGDLIQTIGAVQQQADWLALLGILALEQGEAERAKKSFTQALSVAGPRLDFGARSVAQGWLQLFP